MTALHRMIERYGLPLIGLALWVCFACLASEMLESETEELDTWGLQQAHQWRENHAGAEPLLRDITGIGSPWVLTYLTVMSAGYLVVVKRVPQAVLVAAAMAGGSVVLRLLKLGFGRVRPDSSMAAFVQDGLSFPSGHATMSAVFFLTLGLLLAHQRRHLIEKCYVLALAALSAALIGLSRIGLGVHWTSDVLAGWLLGAGWAVLCFDALLRWERRHPGHPFLEQRRRSDDA